MVETPVNGYRRQAVDLGWHTLPSESLDEAGKRFEPIRSRIVVSKFPSSEARGSGWFDAGWHYEMFVTNLPSDAMPAPDLVTCYYQRTGIENRFRQEDCELGLDRIFSYHVPGQNLANLVGLLVWNLRICRGLGLVDLPEVPAQGAPQNKVLTFLEQAIPERGPDETARSGSFAAGPQVPRVPSLIPKNAVTADAARETTAEAPPVPPQEAAAPAVAEPATSSRAELVPAHLAQLDWPKLMTRHEGWSWNSAATALLCPAGKLANLATVKFPTSMGCGAVRFLVSAADCKACPIRKGCTDSEAQAFRKEKAITIRCRSSTDVDRDQEFGLAG